MRHRAATWLAGATAGVCVAAAIVFAVLANTV